MSTDNSEPAFPVGANDYAGHGTYFGMTLRDYFAAKAMQAGLSTLQSPSAVESIVIRAADLGVEIEQMFAEDSYRVADAMLAARSA